MPRVMCYDLCNTCDGVIIGIWQGGNWEASDFVGSVCNVGAFVLVGDSWCGEETWSSRVINALKSSNKRCGTKQMFFSLQISEILIKVKLIAQSKSILDTWNSSTATDIIGALEVQRTNQHTMQTYLCCKWMVYQILKETWFYRHCKIKNRFFKLQSWVLVLVIQLCPLI